jgi:hypothetical protein
MLRPVHRPPLPGRTRLQLVGLQHHDHGRSCERHPAGCGKHLQVGDLVRFEMAVIDIPAVVEAPPSAFAGLKKGQLMELCVVWGVSPVGSAATLRQRLETARPPAAAQPEGEAAQRDARPLSINLTKAEMMTRCQRQGLPINGDKATLLARLVADVHGAPAPPAVPGYAAQEAPPLVNQERTVCVVRVSTGCVVGFVGKVHQYLFTSIHTVMGCVMRLDKDSAYALERHASERLGGTGWCDVLRSLQ